MLCPPTTRFQPAEATKDESPHSQRASRQIALIKAVQSHPTHWQAAPGKFSVRLRASRRIDQEKDAQPISPPSASRASLVRHPRRGTFYPHARPWHNQDLANERVSEIKTAALRAQHRTVAVCSGSTLLSPAPQRCAGVAKSATLTKQGLGKKELTKV